MIIYNSPLAIDAISIGTPSNYDLFDSRGKLLLAKGELVTENIYQLLLLREIFTSPQIQFQPIETKKFSSKVYEKILGSIQHLYYETAIIDSSQLAKTVELVDVLVDELEQYPKQFVDFNEFRAYDNDLYVHSVNVAILAGMIGAELGYNERQIKEIVLGSLLHDVGKLQIPKQILNRPTGLTVEDFAIIKLHPEKGVEMLRNVSVSTEILNIVRHHHERWDGTGYPYALVGNQNALHSQIVAVADIFDAVTADRPYRKGLPFYHAYELIITNQGLSPAAVNAFKRCICFYPENSLVTLNTGEIGQVVAVPRNYPTRPSVRIFYDAEGAPVKEPLIINLLDDLTTFISSVKFNANVETPTLAPEGS